MFNPNGSFINQRFELSFIMQVEYVDEDISAEFGNTLGVSKTQSIPKVSYEAADAKKMYTLAMVDPDAPSRQVKNEKALLSVKKNSKIQCTGKDLFIERHIRIKIFGNLLGVGDTVQ